MNSLLKSKLLALVTLSFTTWTSFFPALGASYNQQEVAQEQFIAVAAPYGQDRYNLSIVEQIPGQKACWSETGSQPTIVDPLLLNFDFTGSCNRSTDSNGYSLRVAGVDYGLDYLLSIVKTPKELLLVATNRRNTRSKPVIIGTTSGLNQGFLKINLNPGWRFSKRSYEGKTLGHVYFTSDDVAMLSGTVVANTAPVNEKEIVFNAPTTAKIPSTTPLPPLPVGGNDSPNPSDSEINTNSLPLPPEIKTTPINTEVGTNNNKNPDRKTLSDLLVLNPPSEENTEISANVLPVPNEPIPTGKPKPAKETALVKGYRVIVEANNNEQQDKVRSLYPDAFRTNYNGQLVMQVGLFNTEENAAKTVQSLQGEGLKAKIIK